MFFAETPKKETATRASCTQEEAKRRRSAASGSWRLPTRQSSRRKTRSRVPNRPPKSSLSGLREIIFQAEVNPNVPGSGETFGSYSIQPVWPFSHAALPPPAKYDREAPPADLEN
jgi:hypothetical protein